MTEVCLLLEATIQSGTAEDQASRSTTAVGEGQQAVSLTGGEAAVWTLLGQVQAMDEKEVAALRALEEGRRRFEQMQNRSEGAARTMGEGLIVSNCDRHPSLSADAIALQSLAISFTNETLDFQALLAFHRYLQILHPTYAGPVPSAGPDLADEDGSIPNPWSANQRLTESYMNLARDQHQAGIVDADIQMALGVLFYQTGEFERARDCWVSALSVRPNVSPTMSTGVR